MGGRLLFTYYLTELLRLQVCCNSKEKINPNVFIKMLLSSSITVDSQKNWTVWHILVNTEMDCKQIPKDKNEKMDSKNDAHPGSRTSPPQSLGTQSHDNHAGIGTLNSFSVH